MARLHLQAAVLAAILFGFYAYHCAPGVTVEDSGDFILGALTLGTVHPPGYPLNTIMGFLISRLPLIPPAMSVNLLSGLFAAFNAALLFLILNRALEVPRLIAGIAGAALAFHPMVWRQAVVAEVYSLNLFLIASALWSA